MLGLASAGGLSPVLIGCGGGDDGDLSVRLLNLLADTGAVTLRIDGTDRTSTGFEAATGYVGVDAGTFTTEYVANSSGAVLYSANTNYSKDVYYSHTCVGIDGSTGYTTFIDNEDQPSDNVVKVRLSNLVANGQTYDLYLTSANADINSASGTIGSIGPESTSGYAQPSAGGLRIRVTRAGTRDLVYDSVGAFDFSSRHVVTLILYSVGSSELVNCFALFGKDNPNRSQQVPSYLARVRIVNGTDLAERIRIAVNGSNLFSGIPTNAASSYQVLNAGTRDFSVTSESGAVLLASYSRDVSASRDHTLIIAGTAGSYAANLVADLNTRARSGYTKLKVTNAVRDGATAELAVNYRSDFIAIAPASVTAAREYTPATYVFSGVFTVGGVTTSIDFGSYELESGKSYVANLFGDATKRTLTITEVV
jgi:hypothetical protein